MVGWLGASGSKGLLRLEGRGGHAPAPETWPGRQQGAAEGLTSGRPQSEYDRHPASEWVRGTVRENATMCGACCFGQCARCF